MWWVDAVKAAGTAIAITTPLGAIAYGIKKAADAGAVIANTENELNNGTPEKHAHDQAEIAKGLVSASPKAPPKATPAPKLVQSDKPPSPHAVPVAHDDGSPILHDYADDPTKDYGGGLSGTADYARMKNGYT